MITVENIGKSVDGRRIVDDISFTLMPGEVVGLVGPNGAGKSTAMKLMLEVIRGEGSTYFNGRTYSRLDSPLQHVGVLLDPHAYFPGRSAISHLRMLAKGSGLSPAHVARAVERTGLSGWATASPDTYSLGMKQRLGLAAALLGDPETLILDEPANGLDVEGVGWLRQLLHQCASRGRTVLLSSHMLAEIEQVADRILIIGGGKLLADSSLARIKSDSMKNFALVHTNHPDALADTLSQEGASVSRRVEVGHMEVRNLPLHRIGEIAASRNCVLYELSPHDASLEECFVDLVSGHQTVTIQDPSLGVSL